MLPLLCSTHEWPQGVVLTCVCVLFVKVHIYERCCLWKNLPKRILCPSWTKIRWLTVGSLIKDQLLSRLVVRATIARRRSSHARANSLWGWNVQQAKKIQIFFRRWLYSKKKKIPEETSTKYFWKMTKKNPTGAQVYGEIAGKVMLQACHLR